MPTGAALVYVGQTIQIYDPTLTTNRNVAASVVSTVTAADPISSTQTITVDNVPSRHGRQRRDRARRADGRVAGVALRHQVSSEQRHHRHLAQPQPRDLSAATANAARQRGERRAGSRPRAPGDQQGPQSAGHQPTRQTHRLHQRRAGTRLGKSGHHDFPGDQGRRRAAAPATSTCSSPERKRCPAFRSSLR